jgi:hypothetical protein
MHSRVSQWRYLVSPGGTGEAGIGLPIDHNDQAIQQCEKKVARQKGRHNTHVTVVIGVQPLCTTSAAPANSSTREQAGHVFELVCLLTCIINHHCHAALQPSPSPLQTVNVQQPKNEHTGSSQLRKRNTTGTQRKGQQRSKVMIPTRANVQPTAGQQLASNNNLLLSTCGHTTATTARIAGANTHHHSWCTTTCRLATQCTT